MNFSREHVLRNNIMKSMTNTDDIIEKGEGSKGGKVVGHTKSGKAIYGSKKAKDYPDFTKDDHNDAAKLHSDLTVKYKGTGKGDLDKKASEKHSKAANSHWKVWKGSE